MRKNEKSDNVVKVSIRTKAGEKLSELEGLIKIKDLPDTKVVPSIKPSKALEIRVGKHVFTTKKLRVLSGISIPAGHRSLVHGINGDKVKIMFNKASPWVNKEDVRIEV